MQLLSSSQVHLPLGRRTFHPQLESNVPFFIPFQLEAKYGTLVVRKMTRRDKNGPKKRENFRSSRGHAKKRP